MRRLKDFMGNTDTCLCSSKLCMRKCFSLPATQNVCKGMSQLTINIEFQTSRRFTCRLQARSSTYTGCFQPNTGCHRCFIGATMNLPLLSEYMSALLGQRDDDRHCHEGGAGMESILVYRSDLDHRCDSSRQPLPFPKIRPKCTR